MIVVTTPTGNIGSQVVRHLLEAGESVRVIVRDPAKLAPEVREKVEVVTGSHSDPAVVNEAFAGAESVFWLVPPAPQAPNVEAAYVDFTRPACDAIRAQGVKQIVAVSALGRGTAQADHAGLVTAALAMSDLLAGTGVPLRALALPGFMDNMLGQAETIKSQGLFFSPLKGDKKLPACSTGDIAAVAARLLRDHSWTGQEEVAVLGPEDLSQNDMAQIMSEVLGKPVRFQQVPREAFKARLAGFGMSEAFVEGYDAMMAAKNEGLDNAVPRTAETASPTSFRQWCEEVLKPAVLGEN